jgi:hypothetical protein
MHAGRTLSYTGKIGLKNYNLIRIPGEFALFFVLI